MRIVRCFSLLVGLATLGIAFPVRADDTKDCVDAFDKGQQLQKRNKLQNAHLVLLVCAREVCPGLVRKDCGDLVTQIDAAMPSVVITAKDGSGNDLVDVTVEIDGEPAGKKLDGKAQEIDPGVHSFHLETPGAKPLVKQFVVKEGQKSQELAVSFPDLNPPPKPVEARAPVSVPIERTVQTNGPWQWTGIGVAGAGVVGLGIGGVFGVITSSKWNAAQRDCPASVGCLPGSKAYQEKSDATNAGDISTAAFIAGGVLAAGGATLYFFAPSSKRVVTAAIAPTLGGAAIFGTFE